MWDYLIVPFAWIMQQAMNLLNNYALALIAYALITKIIIFPLAMKQQKNSMNMVRLRLRCFPRALILWWLPAVGLFPVRAPK